mmetsp:Transcript_4491/g.5055  ORF Transcript_4491/g.5055 Transcript_4491/m.5055 type:complete len:206 (-) Transcript_4491:223-840(-)
MGSGLDKSTHESQLDVVSLQERFTEVLSQLHQFTHITLLECGQQSVLVLRILQSLGNTSSHSRHLLSSFSSASRLGGGSGSSSLRSLLSRGFLLGSFNLFLFLGGSFGFVRFGFVFRCSRATGLSNSRGIQLINIVSDSDDVTFLSEQFQQLSGFGSSQFDVDLVGFEFSNNFIFINKFSGSLQPRLDTTLRDGITQSGNLNDLV